jgi:predicted dehydrogenase
MTLTPEQQELGRRNFLRALAGTPALAALAGAAALKGPVRGGPVRTGFIGTGHHGRGSLLKNHDPAYCGIQALCDINPANLEKADVLLAEAKLPAAKHYSDWKEMLQKEDLEAVIVAVPLWAHADIVVGCLEAGKHVLCEKMMAWDPEGCRRMERAAVENDRRLEIGYQRFYNPAYQAAYEGIVRKGLLGEVFFARLTWHRNGNWRRAGDPPAPDFDPSPWGYPTWEHLLNWRLYWRYSQGLMAELGSHQIAVADWFFGGGPTAVVATGGVHRFKDGREVPDHVYATYEYPGGRTAVFTSIESNALDDYSEAFYGTKGSLIIAREREFYLFHEGEEGKATAVELSPKGGPVLDATESRPAQTGAVAGGRTGDVVERPSSYRNEISGFCAAVRTGTPLRVGPAQASLSARACIGANRALQDAGRIEIGSL